MRNHKNKSCWQEHLFFLCGSSLLHNLCKVLPLSVQNIHNIILSIFEPFLIYGLRFWLIHTMHVTFVYFSAILDMGYISSYVQPSLKSRKNSFHKRKWGVCQSYGPLSCVLPGMCETCISSSRYHIQQSVKQQTLPSRNISHYVTFKLFPFFIFNFLFRDKWPK